MKNRVCSYSSVTFKEDYRGTRDSLKVCSYVQLPSPAFILFLVDFRFTSYSFGTSSLQQRWVIRYSHSREKPCKL